MKAMTAQEKLHAVETAIRKALPRLMEPTEGCRILEHGEPLEQYSVILAERSEGKYLIYTPYNLDNPCEEIDQKELSENYEILGHDILLSDVLEWFDNLKHETIRVSQITTKGTLIGTEDTDTLRAVKFGKWDLSKPRLADQSEELWNFLYNLIKED